MPDDAFLTPPPLEARPERIARAEERLATLQELSELAMTLARVTVRQAVEAAEAPPAPNTEDKAPAAPRRDPADTFSKLSRVVRLTLVLEAKFEAGVHEAAAKAAAAREADPYAPLKSGRKARARELVREVIDREIPDAEENDTIVDALEERLLCDEAYDHIDDLPMRDIVEHLCVDLQLNPDWRRWTGEGWKPNPPFTRPLCSEFAAPSRTTILNDLDDPDPLE